MTEMLRAGVLQNHPDSRIRNDINRAFGISLTRNSVIGKRTRLFGTKPKSDTASNNKRTKVRRVTSGRSFPAASTHSKPLPPEPKAITSQTNCSLMQLEDGMCKWLVGDDLYCGGAVAEFRKPYCFHHMNIQRRGYGEAAISPHVAQKRSRWSI